jgi:hypothetical protein
LADVEVFMDFPICHGIATDDIMRVSPHFVGTKYVSVDLTCPVTAGATLLVLSFFGFGSSGDLRLHLTFLTLPPSPPYLPPSHTSPPYPTYVPPILPSLPTP